jgi:hypothetical protein
MSNFKKGDYVICTGDVMRKIYHRQRNIVFEAEYDAIIIDECHYGKILIELTYKMNLIKSRHRVDSQDIYYNLKKIRDEKISKLIM